MVRRGTAHERRADGNARRPRSEAAEWFSADELARSAALHRGVGRLRCWRAVLDVAVPSVFVLAGLGALTTRVFPGAVWVDRAVATMVIVELTRAPHRLLIDGWVEVVRPRREGAAPSAGLFVLSFAGLAVVRLVVGSALLVAAVSVLRATPWWPALAWSAAVAAAVVAGGVYPLLVAPIADRAVPLTDPVLRADLETMARQAGLALPRVLVATNPSLGEGAYVAGIGRTRALVLGADLALGQQVHRREPSAIAAVVAHELGHWRLGHQRASLAALSAAIAVLVAAVWGLGQAGAARAVGAVDLADPRALPLWLVAGGVVGFGGRVGLAALSRAQERAADRFALALVGERKPLADHLRAHFVASGGELDPRGWWRLMATHPTPSERLALLGAPTQALARSGQPVP